MVCVLKVYLKRTTLLSVKDFCSSWFHHKCVKISKKDYDQISRLGEKIRWFCGPCDARMQTVISSDCDLKNLLVTGFNELKEAVNSVCKVQENTKKKLSNIVTHHVKLSTNINLIAKQCGLKAEATSRADDADDTSPSNVMEKIENNLPPPVSDDNCTASFSTSNNDLQSSATIANDISTASDLTTNFSLAHVGVGTPVCSRVEVEDTCKHKNTANCDVFNAGEVRKPDINGGITYASALKNPQNPKLGRDIPGVIGTNVKTALKSVGKQEWLFISRLQPSTTTTDVSNFLTSEGIQNVECTELKSKYNSYKSFKVGVCKNDFDRVLTSEFWPTNIFVRKFLPARPSRHHRPSRPTQIESRTFLGKQKHPLASVG